MDDDRIDFSPLDPMRDPARFERMVRAVAGARGPGASPAAGVSLELLRWGRAAVAIAAALAAAAWVPALVRDRATARAGRGDAVDLVAEWAQAGEVPRDADLIQTFGGSDGR